MMQGILPNALKAIQAMDAALYRSCLEQLTPHEDATSMTVMKNTGEVIMTWVALSNILSSNSHPVAVHLMSKSALHSINLRRSSLGAGLMALLHASGMPSTEGVCFQ